MALNELVKKHFGDVSDEQLKAMQDIVDETIKTRAPEVTADKATEEALTKLRADLDTEKARGDTEKARGDVMATELAALKSRSDIDPDESRIAMDRVSKMTSLPDISTLVREPAQDEKEKSAQVVWDDLHLLSTALCNRTNGNPRGVKSLDYWRKLSVVAPSFAKALDTATATEGAEWAPTEYGTQMIDAVNAASVVAPIFPQITMPRQSYNLPFGFTGGTVYLAGEATGDTPADYTATTPATGSETFTAKKLAMLINMSEEMEEESVVPVLPLLRDHVARTIASGIDDAILDGQATGAIDSDVTSSADRRMAWDGLRYFISQTLTTAFSSAATFNGDLLGSVMELMTQKYLDKNADMVWIFPSKKKYDIMTIEDNGTEHTKLFIRASDLGDNVVLRGQVGELLGNPVVFSGAMRVNLNASGVYDGSTTTKTWACYVNRNAWWLGNRREIRMEVERKPAGGYSRLIATWRGSFKRVQPAADVHTGGLYNW